MFFIVGFLYLIIYCSENTGDDITTKSGRKKSIMKCLICQCCGLPFSPKTRGINRDQSLNSDYCFNCFRNGEFTDRHLTIRDMEKKLLDMAKHNDEVSIEEAHQTIAILPDLKRWKMTHIL